MIGLVPIHSCIGFAIRLMKKKILLDTGGGDTMVMMMKWMNEYVHIIELLDMKLLYTEVVDPSVRRIYLTSS